MVEHEPKLIRLIILFNFFNFFNIELFNDLFFGR